MSEQYQEANSSVALWKLIAIVLGIVALGAIILAIMGFNKSPDTKKCAETNTDTSKQDSNSNSGSGSNSSSSSSNVTVSNLKNFDIAIVKLINAAGFKSASIMSLKTNAEGSYLIGEVKADNVTKFGYRPLPDGEWALSAFTKEGDNACKDIPKAELDAFANVKVSDNADVKCKDTSGTSETKYTAAEALDKGLYKQ